MAVLCFVAAIICAAVGPYWIAVAFLFATGLFLARCEVRDELRRRRMR